MKRTATLVAAFVLCCVLAMILGFGMGHTVGVHWCQEQVEAKP